MLNSENTTPSNLSVHSLASGYRVAGGTLSTEYDRLDASLRGVGAVANLKVLSKGALGGVAAKDTQAEIRLLLSTAKLPKPFQINALTSKNWHLDSGWKSLTISQE